MLTLGVEEELLLLDPEGAALPVAPDVQRRVADDRVKPEMMTYQVEVASGVCTSLGQLERQLTGLRRRLAAAAERVGARLVAAGAPPLDDPGLDFLTDSDRYREMAARFPAASAVSGTCACQVHVGVLDRELAVQVLGRLRPWLPALFALSTNSPMRGGLDSGWSSTRYGRLLGWPTFAAPKPWRTSAAYDRAVGSLVRRGAALDARSVYFLARLSPRYPTIEIRVADTCLEVADALLLAGVSRALVASLAADVRRRRPPDSVPDPELRADLLGVAHQGAPTRAFSTERLLRKILPELERTGDADRVVAGVERVAAAGAGAQRQRRLLAGATTPGQFISAMAGAALSETPVPRPA